MQRRVAGSHSNASPYTRLAPGPSWQRVHWYRLPSQEAHPAAWQRPQRPSARPGPAIRPKPSMHERQSLVAGPEHAAQPSPAQGTHRFVVGCTV